MDRLVSISYVLRALFQIYGSRVGELRASLPTTEVTSLAGLEVVAGMVREVMSTTGQGASDILRLEDARFHASPDAANLTWNGASIAVRYDRELGWVCLALPAGLGSKARMFKPAVGFSTRDEAADLATCCVLKSWHARCNKDPS